MQTPELAPADRLPGDEYIAACVFLVALLFLLLPPREKIEAWVLGFWMLAGFALNLVALEHWYRIYFVLPTILVLAWGTVKARDRWARALGLIALAMGMGSNLGQVLFLLHGPYASWRDYQGYAAALASRIPADSKVLLLAIPDPYFGLQSRKKAYRLYEFVPEGIPVDRSRAEKTLASIDYVVDSDCCHPAYLQQYLKAHAKLVGEVASPVPTASPVRVWKLAGP